jgi:peroxiredoxin
LTELKIGDAAPEFNLMDERGFPVRLKDFLGKKTVVLYFYPKDFTSGAARFFFACRFVLKLMDWQKCLTKEQATLSKV